MKIENCKVEQRVVLNDMGSEYSVGTITAIGRKRVLVKWDNAEMEHSEEPSCLLLLSVKKERVPKKNDVIQLYMPIEVYLQSSKTWVKTYATSEVWTDVTGEEVFQTGLGPVSLDHEGLTWRFPLNKE